MALLEVTGLAVGRAGEAVLSGVQLAVEEGETLVVLGLDGSGKTTLAGTLAGLLPPLQGGIAFDGEEVTSEGVTRMVARRLVLVPEGGRVFTELTVEENLLVGGWARRADPTAGEEGLQRARRCFPVLAERWGDLAGTLAPVEQRMLALARGVMGGPRLLVIDEVSLGMGAEELDLLLDGVLRIVEGGVTVLLLDRRVLTLGLADRAVVLRDGQVVYNGPAHELRESPRMRRELLAATRGGAS